MKIQKNKILKRIGSMALSLALVAGFAATSVKAADTLADLPEVNTTQHNIKYWGYDFRNSGLPNAYDPITGKNTNDNFRSHYTNQMFYFKDSQGKYSYCVQMGTEQVDSVKMSQLDFSDENALGKYYPNETHRKHIGYATVYAYCFCQIYLTHSVRTKFRQKSSSFDSNAFS